MQSRAILFPIRGNPRILKFDSQTQNSIMDTRPEVDSDKAPVYDETMEKSSEVMTQHIQPLLDS